MRPLHLALALSVAVGGFSAGAHAAAGSRSKATPAARKASKAKRPAKKPAARGKAKLRKATRSKAPKVQQVSPRQLGMVSQLRLGPGSDVVHQYATKKGWTKLDATGGSTHVVAVSGGTASFRDPASGKLKTLKFNIDSRSTSFVHLYDVPPNTKVRFKVNVIASTDGGRSFTKRPKDALVFETVIP